MSPRGWDETTVGGGIKFSQETQDYNACYDDVWNSHVIIVCNMHQ